MNRLVLEEEAQTGTAYLNDMNQQPIPQLRFEPGGLRGHDLLRVGDGHQLIQ